MNWFLQLQNFLESAVRPLIVIVGTTASGKTAFSIELAKKLSHVEIVNSDSRQLYKYLNIGTAKITPAEMAGIPHHMIDVIDPTFAVSTGWYKRETEKVIDQLHEHSKVPMLVGGSMLYISAITDNYSLPAPSDPLVRQQLQERLEREGLQKLYDELCISDPISAKKIHPNNTQHIVRALEFLYQSGTPKSTMLDSLELPPKYSVFIIGILRNRAAIVERITQRTKDLLAAGWIDEVRQLLAMGYSLDDPGMMSHGYRDCIEYCLHNGDLSTLEQRITKQTCDYAKRQMTWWKRDKRIVWLQPQDLLDCGIRI